MGERERRTDDRPTDRRREEMRRLGQEGWVRWPLTHFDCTLLPLAKKPFIKKTRVQAQFRDRTFLIGPSFFQFFLLAARQGGGGGFFFVPPSPPSYILPAAGLLRHPHTHNTLHGDASATAAINVPNGVPPPLHFCTLTFPGFRCTKKKKKDQGKEKKMADFYKSTKPRPLPLLKYWRVLVYEKKV